MAVTEWLVVAPQSNGKASTQGLRTFNGGAAGTGIADSAIKDATVFIVEAESNTEAGLAVKQLYPGSVAEKVIVVKKSVTTEN